MVAFAFIAMPLNASAGDCDLDDKTTKKKRISKKRKRARQVRY